MRVPYPLTFAPVHRPTLSLRWVAFTAVACVAAGCRPSPEQIAEGDDPVAALAAAVPSERYDGLYWRTQRRRDPALFARAAGYCHDEERAGRLGERPTCEAVLSAERFVEGEDRPRVQGRGFSGTLDDGSKNAPTPEGSRITVEPAESR